MWIVLYIEINSRFLANYTTPIKNIILCLSIAVSGFLLSGTQASAQTCGDIIQTFNFGNGFVEERKPVEDCSNPFDVSDQPTISEVTITADDGVLTNGAILTIGGLSDSVSLAVEVVPDEYGVYSELFKHDGEDYRAIRVFSNTNFSINAVGTYTLVTIVDEFAFPVERLPIWKDILRSLVPIAYAQAPETQFPERFATTFNVALAESEPHGASSVLFLPGIQASRLYTDGILGTENRLWEPLTNADVRKLEMTTIGESVNEIYTRDVLDEIFGTTNVYKGFLRFLDGLISDGFIDDWKPYSYDWRYDVFDVVENGAVYRDSGGENSRQVYPIDVLEELASSSKSGQVTIVAHSNGGLLAKAIMLKLESEGKTDLVDNLILVGSPQLGTPKAVATVLHGYGQAILLGGLIATPENSRSTSLNMPGAYGLLPSQAYFDSTNEPLVFFDDSVNTELFRNQYGNAINTADELAEFMIGSEGRPAADSIDEAALSNSRFIQEAQDYHNDLLDTWEAPEGVSVAEVVGVGLNTEKAFEYQGFSERVCSAPDIFGTRECEKIALYKPVPQMTLFGDGTVVGNSAEGYSNDKETFYYNLFTDDLYQHVNLTESDSVQTLVSNILSETIEEVEFFSDSRPEFTQNSYMIGVHSPVSISIIDSRGDRVGFFAGELEEDIPGSSYREIAGSKYIIVPLESDFEVLIEGQTEGGMTLTVHKLENDSQTEIVNIPVEIITSSTSVSFTNSNKSLSNILIDTDGNQEIDLEFKPDGTVVVEEIEEVTYEVLRETISALSLKSRYKRHLLRKVRLAERMSLKTNEAKIFARLEILFLRGLKWQLRLYNRNDLITDIEYEEIKKIIKELK